MRGSTSSTSQSATTSRSKPTSSGARSSDTRSSSPQPQSSSSSQTRSPSKHRSSRHDAHHARAPSIDKDQNRGKLIKDSAGLLVGIGVAAVLAQKLWPKGMPYGSKEEWETRVNKVKNHIKEDLPPREGTCSRHERPRRHGESHKEGRDREFRLANGSVRLMNRGHGRNVKMPSIEPRRQAVYEELDYIRRNRHGSRDEDTLEVRRPVEASGGHHRRRVDVGS